ncbi:hypothetical protein A2Z10_00360 [Candidatus Azambacteria bacterium RBG_16_47_10]|uniref:Uncharacterized protein n=1 Tax=Candidatus Azambacteria bacterium RBG_16_47_10 TaxID=1797292 RepID=A0A1F5B1H6_9BACT|nr:MAG: hypothetical protein A2Z10_00360 [Candidatus Azambacteria bacterium RBG_16_47_10]
MAYATSYSQKYQSRASGGSFFSNMAVCDTHMAMRIGVVCIMVLGIIYVSETNALMFLERTIPMKERAMTEIKNDVQTLEIQATRLQTSQAVQDIALSHAMIASHDIRYVSGGDSAVAMVPPAR